MIEGRPRESLVLYDNPIEVSRSSQYLNYVTLLKRNAA